MGKSLQYYQKKFNRQLICNKNYLKAGKKINTKQVILIDLVYKKNENYYCKKILETCNFNKDKENCSNNSYCVDYDEEYYHVKCVDLILETTRKI